MNRRAFLAAIAGTVVAPHVRTMRVSKPWRMIVRDGAAYQPEAYQTEGLQIQIQFLRDYRASDDQWINRLDVLLLSKP